MRTIAGIESSGLWLAIDTSTAMMTVSLLRDGVQIGERHSAAERNHSILLVPAIEELLASAGVSPSELAGIAVGQGPGSYTGVRIAASVGKTFAWSLGVPLAGVSSLSALAHGACREWLGENGAGEGSSIWVVPLMDARRGRAYTGLYALEGGKWREVLSDGIRSMDEWVDQLAGLAAGSDIAIGESNQAAAGESGSTISSVRTNPSRPDRVLFVGEPGRFGDTLSRFNDRGGDGAVWVPFFLGAYDVGLLALERWGNGETDDTHDFAPNYTQIAEAEQKLLDASKGEGNGTANGR